MRLFDLIFNRGAFFVVIIRLLIYNIDGYKNNQGGGIMAKEYVCPKCGGTSYQQDEMRATGGTFSKLFDIQNKKFTTISCENCGYTEFFKKSTSALGNIFDFLTD